MPPSIEDRHGLIRNYSVYLTNGRQSEVNSTSIQWKRFTVDGSVTNKIFSNLSKWTNYSVYVVCRTVGDSDRSKIWTNSTDEDSESLPRFIFLKYS